MNTTPEPVSGTGPAKARVTSPAAERTLPPMTNTTWRGMMSGWSTTRTTASAQPSSATPMGTLQETGSPSRSSSGPPAASRRTPEAAVLTPSTHRARRSRVEASAVAGL